MPTTEHKLNADHQLELLNLLAQGHSSTYIRKFFNEYYDIEISKQTVHYYRNNYRDEIQKRKAHVMQQLPISDRAWRQMVRQMLINDILHTGRLWNKDKRYDKDGNLIRTVLKGNHNVINQILDSAAKDADDFSDSGDSTVMQFKAMIQIKGEAARRYLETGELPSLETVKALMKAESTKKS